MNHQGNPSQNYNEIRPHMYQDAQVKRRTVTSVNEDMDQLEPPYIIRLYKVRPHWKMAWQSLKRLNESQDMIAKHFLPLCIFTFWKVSFEAQKFSFWGLVYFSFCCLCILELLPLTLPLSLFQVLAQAWAAISAWVAILLTRSPSSGAHSFFP